MHATGAPVPPAYPAPVPASASAPVAARGVHKTSSVTPGGSRRDERQECSWECLRDCGHEGSSWAAVRAHEQVCRAPMHPTELAPSANPQAEQGSSGYSTAPESAGSSTSVGSARASTRRPDHAARIRVVLQARLMALLLRSSVRGVFRAWRRLVPSWPMDAQHRSDDELSVASASSARGRHRRAHRRKCSQRQARRPPNRHGFG